MRPSRPLLLLLFAIVCGLGAVFSLLSTIAFVMSASQRTAQVVGVRPCAQFSESWCAELTVPLREGEVAQALLATAEGALQHGDSVEVLYRGDDPTDVRLSDPAAVWRNPVTWAAFAILWLLLALVGKHRMGGWYPRWS